MSIDPTFLALLGDFVEETLPMAENVGTAMLGLERSWKEGQNDPALLQSMKSDLHTIKGNSAMMGLTPIQSLSHALEDVCALFSEAPSARSATTAQLFLDGTDLLASMIRTSMEGEVDAAASARLVERIARYVKGEDAAQPKAQAERPLPTEAAAPAAVAGDGPSPAPEPPAESTAARAQPHKTPSSDSPKREDHELRPEGEAHAQEPTAAGRGRSGIESVRIDSRRLDELLELTAELVITHSSLSRIHRRLLVANGATDDVQELDLSILSLSKIVKQLQESLMVARLLPVSMLFGKFSRYVRDLGREKGQPIKLVTAGGETPIDKTLIDRLSEPLMHLVRNSVAHGIEPLDARARAGKPAEATITLAARWLSDRVVIVVGDDGRGLDVAAIFDKARAMGIDPRGMQEDDARRLIFMPSFSTANSVSELSGRGVGLDVVAATIHGLGGSVEVESKPGRGCAFVLNLPLTLSVIKGLLVEVDRETFVVPAASIIESLRVEAGAIHEIHRLGMLPWRSILIHVSDGGVLLGTQGSGGHRRPYCVVVTTGSKHRGLLVDQVVGYQDIVVKKLDESLGRPELVSGVTILGDGRVVPILDAARLVEQRAMGFRSSARAPDVPS